MATDLHFIPGRTKSSENPVLNGYRFVSDKKGADNTVYWRCKSYRTHSCSARMVTSYKRLTSPVLSHNHGPEPVRLEVHVRKQSLKKDTNIPTMISINAGELDLQH